MKKRLIVYILIAICIYVFASSYIKQLSNELKNNAPNNNDIIDITGGIIHQPAATLIDGSNNVNCSDYTMKDGILTVYRKYNGSFLDVKEIHLTESAEYIPVGMDLIYGDIKLPTKDLKSITVDNKNKYFSAIDGVLYNKDKTALYLCSYMEGSTFNVPQGVKTIKAFAFQNTDCARINLPISVTMVEQGSMGHANKTEIPPSVQGDEDMFNLFEDYMTGPSKVYGKRGSYIESVVKEYNKWLKSQGKYNKDYKLTFVPVNKPEWKGY